MSLNTNQLDYASIPVADFASVPVEEQKTIDLGNVTFRKLDDGKQKGVVIDAMALKALYQKLGILYKEGVDKEFIAGYSLLLDVLNTNYDTNFGA